MAHLLPALIRERMPWNFDDVFKILAENGESVRGVMRIDLKETPSEYIVQADLPGMTKNEISVTLVDQVLTITAEHGEKSEERDADYLVRERRFQSVERSIPLRLAGSPENVKAEFRDGVLEVTVKKAPEKQTKRIAIQ